MVNKQLKNEDVSVNIQSFTHFMSLLSKKMNIFFVLS